MNKIQSKDSSKQRILKSATSLFAKKGYEAVGIREICKEADANICMISYYWGGKRELYEGIIKDLIEKQNDYAKQFTDYNIEPSKLQKKEQIKLLYIVLDKIIDFLYGNSISDDLFKFLLRAQQSRDIELNSPAFSYFRKIIAAIFNKEINDKDIILKTVFIISQINSPKILPAFSLGLLKQENFTQDDVQIIKDNVKLYIETLLKEAKIV